jgi:hypothetical protein
MIAEPLNSNECCIMPLFDQLLLQVRAGDILVVAAVVIIALFILWIIVSIPVWIAAKLLTGGRARFTRAMLVTAIGPIIYAVVFFASSAILALTFGDRTALIAISLILAFIAWIAVFKKGFDVGWVRAFGIAVLATLVFAVFGIVISLAMHAVVPQAPPVTPFPLQQA